MHFAWLVMWCIVDAGKRSESVLGSTLRLLRALFWRDHDDDEILVLSDFRTVVSVRLIFGIVDLEFRACYICISSGSYCL